MEKENYIFFKECPWALRHAGCARQASSRAASVNERYRMPTCSDFQGRRLGGPDERKTGTTRGLGCVAHYFIVEGFVAFLFITISQFLALDAIGGPRYGSDPFRADFLFAMEARSKRAIINSAER